MPKLERLLGPILKEFQPRLLLPSLTVSLVAGVLEVIFAISLAVLIFSGNLSEYVSIGSGLALFSIIVVNAVIAVTSSLSGIIANVQESAAVLLAVVAGKISTSMPASASPEETFLTVVAAIVLTSILTGIFFLSLSWFKLGDLIRFIPYPVVGGFLAGTGWVLVISSISIMADVSLLFSQLPELFQPEVLIKWLPGLLFALLILVIWRRYTHFLIIPGLLLGGMGLFYLALLLTGTSVEQATVQGLLLGSFPQGNLWQPLSFQAMTRARWLVLLGQLANIATISLVSAVNLLLNASGLEVAVDQELELNNELRAAGIANIVAGLGGGFIGYHGLALSAFSQRVGAKSRLVGLCLSCLAAVTLFFGASVLSFLPKLLLGGLLLFLGLDFLVTWVYDSWFKITKADYLVIILILVVIGTADFLSGVGIGLLVTVVLFVINYSRIGATKRLLSGANYHSNVTRLPHQERGLLEKGEQIYILELQGFIFFGTAHNLLTQIRQFLSDSREQPLRFVVLDFRLVTGVDSSAVLSFVKMKQMADKQQVSLVFTSISGKIEKLLRRSAYFFTPAPICPLFPDLDRGLEWCENQILETIPFHPCPIPSLSQHLEKLFDSAELVSKFISYLQHLEIPSGYVIFRQGEPPQGLYFLESGQVSVLVKLPNGQTKRLGTFDGGNIFGEMGFCTQELHSASVVTDQPSSLYYLSPEAFAKIETEDPLLKISFQKFIISSLVKRLKRSQEELRNLL